ncbi:MAG: AAA family ATPase [Bacteroidaceae bacterium]|nr:AAA family ATPase [Bacteroidaceae bacterium]
MKQEETKRRGYAVGVQTFDWIRERGSAYIDKTEYVWKMVSTDAVNFFLSRPRRFGKSLLVDTLRCYFEGRKELFEGLYIYDKEKEWKKYPVIRLDLSNGKYFEKEGVHPTINFILEQQERYFGIAKAEDPTNYDIRLSRLIQTAYEQTGEQVVILIDEYDAPMLDSINNLKLQDYIRNRIRNLFSPLKSQAKYLRFVFLTGISKFSQHSVFSELNNLQQITFAPEYEGICGITEEELLTEWKPDIELLTEKMNITYSRWGLHYTYDDIVQKLKDTYDGYHFSNHFTDIYCPWSLVNAFAMGDIQNFWFSTGTPSMLINVMQQHNISIQQIEHFRANLRRFDAPTERISDPIPVLFQSGYLTLKDYDPTENEFVLGFPNGEVREGFAYSLYKYYTEDYVGSEDTLGRAFKRLRRKDITIEEFIENIRLWYAGIPYSITDKNQNEQLYQSLIYAALMGFGADVSAEEQTSDGRMDIALKLQDAIYIIELKYNKTAEAATDQIITKNYAVRFASDPRPVIAVGLNISQDRRTIDSYKVVKVK